MTPSGLKDPGLHPNEEGPRFIAGKAYFWDKVDGRLTLLPWPDDEDGQPVPDPRSTT